MNKLRRTRVQVSEARHGARESIMDLGPIAGVSPKNRWYVTATGRRVYVYAESSAPAKCRARMCSCPTPEDRADCDCVAVKIDAGYGAMAYTTLPATYRVGDEERA